MKKRRILALLLALVICGGQVPFTARAAVSASDAQAYLRALDQTQPENSFLIDFDGDGRDELLTTKFIYNGEYADAVEFSVWQGEQVLTPSVYVEVAMTPTCAICTKDGKTYLRISQGISHEYYRDHYTVQNGQWVNETAMVLYRHEFSTYVINGSEVDEATFDNVENSFQTQSSINIDEGSGDVRSQLKGIIEAETRSEVEAIKNATTPDEILASIAYIGDRSKCKMDADMANAYAEVIEGLPSTYETEWGRSGALYATLADFADDGYPILITMHLDKTPEPYEDWSEDEERGRGGYIIKDPAFWCYEDGRAYDAQLPRLNYYNGYGKLNGNKGLIYIKEFFHDVGHTRHTWYYTVSTGQIKLDRTIAECDACEYQPGIGSIDDREIPAAELERDGWVKEETEPYRRWYFVTDNGKDVTQKYLNMDPWYEDVPAGPDHWLELIRASANNALLGPDYKAEIADIIADIDDSQYDMNIDSTVGATVSTALRHYAAVAPGAVYPNLTELESGGEHYDAIVRAALEKVDGEVVGVYKLSDDLYVVVVLVGETQRATLVRGAREKGASVWRAEAPGELPAEEELGQMAAQAATRPNVSLDYEKLPSLTDSAALSDYLKERLDNMEGLTPNDPAKTELGAFLESAIANQAVTSISGKGNRVTIDGAAVAPLVRKARETQGEMEDLLGERDISLNKPIVLILRLFWENADRSKPCQIELDETLARELQDCSAQLLLGDDRHYLQFTAQQLQDLLQAHGALSVQFSQVEDGIYDIRFLDKDGNVVESLAAPVTVGLPAESMTSTVMASYTGGSDNWGGQYDQNVGTLRFETRFSGRYEVLENDLAVSDIGNLSEESQQAIRFLVSKGFLTLEGDSFRPGDSLTRYEFTQALVGMFFALDRSLTADFPDVPADSPYYPYVASAQAKSIVNGYADGTFSGGDPITREQVLALAARTLVDQKGYTRPQDVETYLSGFADRQDISAWAEDQVALAVREGVASRGNVILPKNNITREQAAVVLYRLFLLLYEVRPVALEVPASTQGGSTAVIVGAVTAAVVGGAGIGGGVWAALKKRRKR